MNGVLKKYIKGPKQPIIQIASRCILAVKRDIIELNSMKNEEAKEFCKSLNEQKQKSKCIKENINFSNTQIHSEQTSEEVFEERNLLAWKRYTFKAEKKSLIIRSDDATFTMTVRGETIYGVIQQILFSNSSFYFMYKTILVENVQELLIGTETDHEKLVKVNDSVKKCVRIYASNKLFIRIVKHVPWVD